MITKLTSPSLAPSLEALAEVSEPCSTAELHWPLSASGSEPQSRMLRLPAGDAATATAKRAPGHRAEVIAQSPRLSFSDQRRGQPAPEEPLLSSRRRERRDDNEVNIPISCSEL
jgi:hypothetical protein